MFNLVKTLYCVRHAITSEQVWAYADANTITPAPAKVDVLYPQWYNIINRGSGLNKT